MTGPAPALPRPGALTVLRVALVVLGGPFACLVAVLAAAVDAARCMRAGRAPRTRTAAILGVAGVYGASLPRIRGWGATASERSGPMTGDEVVPRPSVQHTRAVTIDAPAEQVWPWLAQIGQDRAGFYSYAWLENLAGCRMRNADTIHPEWSAATPAGRFCCTPRSRSSSPAWTPDGR